MTELNIKKEIGKRILEARKAKGLTLKALGELAGGFKQARMTNWEQGIRTPGPEEIKQLAHALDVSPAYLMCLSDEKQLQKAKSPSQLIPLLDYQKACDINLYAEATYQVESNSRDTVFISVSTELLPNLSEHAFALKVTNDSMLPEIKVNDVLVVEPIISPDPGDYVVVKIAGKNEAVICQYKKLSYTSSEFELLTLNDNWPDIKVHDSAHATIIGKLIQNIRNY